MQYDYRYLPLCGPLLGLRARMCRGRWVWSTVTRPREDGTQAVSWHDFASVSSMETMSGIGKKLWHDGPQCYYRYQQCSIASGDLDEGGLVDQCGTTARLESL